MAYRDETIRRESDPVETDPSRRRSLLVVAPSAELYGSDRALLNVLPAMVEAFSVTVAVPASGPLVSRARDIGAVVLVLPDYAIRRRHLRPAAILPWWVRIVRAAAAVRRVHRRERFDVVYSNTMPAGVVLGAVLRVLLRRPHVLHIHEYPFEGRLLPRLLLWVARATSNRVICNSGYTRDLVVASQPRLRGRTRVVHNGIDLPSPVQGDGRHSRLQVVCVGRIHPKKGQAHLVKAARLAADQGGDWDLHFYGDALPEHAYLQLELEALVSDYGLGERVFFHGFVAETQALYAGADVVVVPSVVPEEFSLVCVEAQSMELPVVATGPGGPSEVLVDGETGYVVPPRDPIALAAAIQALDRDPLLRKEMGRKGRDRMLTHFTREVYAEAVVGCLSDL